MDNNIVNVFPIILGTFVKYTLILVLTNAKITEHVNPATSAMESTILFVVALNILLEKIAPVILMSAQQVTLARIMPPV